MHLLDLDDLNIATGNYTVEEIDEHLKFISELERYSKDDDLVRCKMKADYWLDKRLEVMQYG